MTGSGTLTNEGRRVRLRLALMLVGLAFVALVVRIVILYFLDEGTPVAVWPNYVAMAIPVVVIIVLLVLAWDAWTSRARWVRLLCRRLFP
jgi:ABC-type nickel/cobalt efflux system permease component RcnA